MTALAGTITYQTTVYVTAASSGDATTIANLFNGVTIPGVDIAGTATATASSATVTISWPASQVRVADQEALVAVTNIIAPMTSLTSPITTIYARIEGKIV